MHREYYYPEEVDRTTKRLRRTIVATDTTITLISEIPMSLTGDDYDTLAKMWLEGVRRYSDQRRLELLESIKSESQKREEESWNNYLKSTNRPSISEWRRLAGPTTEKGVEPR